MYRPRPNARSNRPLIRSFANGDMAQLTIGLSTEQFKQIDDLSLTYNLARSVICRALVAHLLADPKRLPDILTQIEVIPIKTPYTPKQRVVGPRSKKLEKLQAILSKTPLDI